MKINIIGGGISGLTLGCYLQKSGFETSIYEKNLLPGGLCTSWIRGEYTFDGCLHWVLGSGKGSPFYKLWSEILDMESVDFVTHEVSVEIEVKDNSNKYGEKVFRFYTNIARLEAYMLDLAPEDKRMIKSLIRLTRTIQKYEMPPMIDNIPKLQTFKQQMGMVRYLPFIVKYLKWRSVTNYSFARHLKNPFLREAFELLFDGDEVNMLIMTMPLAFYDSKSAGYPIGGSAFFARRIADKYESLGGKIYYNKETESVIVENNVAKGLIFTDGSKVLSDITISTADWYSTVFKALNGKYVDKGIMRLANLKKLKTYPSVVLVSLGMAGDFNNYPCFFRFPIKNPYKSPDGTNYDRIEVHIYNYDPTLAPKGKTVISMSFYTRNGEFWIKLRQSDRERYNRCKEEFAQVMITALDEKLGKIKEAVEVMDVATPATYNRYTGNWKGSAQGWFPGRNLIAASPVKTELPRLKNFYYTSHWSIPGGGLPSVIKSSHDLAQIIKTKSKC